MKDTKLIERQGVALVQNIVCSQFGWIFREQLSDDYGVDAHIEIKDDSYASGKIIGVQIKTGESYFNTKGNTGKLVFSKKHFYYWSNYSLPVIVVFVNISTNKCYWEYFNIQNLEKTTQGKYRIQAKNKVFDYNAKSDLLKIAYGIYCSFPSNKTLDIYNSLKNDSNISECNYSLFDLEKVLDMLKSNYNDLIQRNTFDLLEKVTNNDFSKLDLSHLNLYGIRLFNNKLISKESQAKFNNTLIYSHNFYPPYICENDRIMSVNCTSNSRLEVAFFNNTVKTWDLDTFKCIKSEKDKNLKKQACYFTQTPNNKLYVEIEDIYFANRILIYNKKRTINIKIDIITCAEVLGCDFSNAKFSTEVLRESLSLNGAIVNKTDLFI